MYFPFLKNRNISQRMSVIFLLGFFIVASGLFTLSISSDREVDVYFFECLTFRASQSDKTLLEIFSQISAQKLTFEKSVDGYLARYEFSIGLQNQLDDQIKWTHLIDTVKVKSLSDISDLSPELIRVAFVVPPGEYRAEIYIIDLKTHSNLSFIKNITVPDYGNSGLKLSDLQISTSVTPAVENSVIVKYNWKILPNVARLFGARSNILYVYSELYNLSFRSNEPNEGFIASYSIKNHKGTEVKTLELTHEKPGKSTVLIVKIPIQELESGQYQLILHVTDLENGQKIEKSIYFTRS